MLGKMTENKKKWLIQGIFFIVGLLLAFGIVFAFPKPVQAQWVFRTIPNTPTDDVYPNKWGLNGYSLIEHNGASYLYIYGEHYRTDSSAYPTKFALHRYKWNDSTGRFEYYDTLTNTTYNGDRRRFYARPRLRDWPTGVYMFRHEATIAGSTHWANVNRPVTFSDWISIGESETARIALVYYDSENDESKIRIRNAEVRNQIHSISVDTSKGVVMDIRGALVSTDDGYDVRTFNDGRLKEHKSGEYHVKGTEDTGKSGSQIYVMDPDGKQVYTTYNGVEYSLGINGKPYRYGKREMTIPVSEMRKWTKLGKYSVDYEMNVKSDRYGTLSKARGRLKAPSGYSKTIKLQSTDGAYRNYRVYETVNGNLNIEVTDATPPTASTSQSPTSWTSGNVTLRVYNIADTGGSGYYRTLLPNGTFSTSTDIQFTVSQNGTYSFTIYDRQGNSTVKTFNVTNIDKTAPSVSFNPNGNSTYEQSHFTTVTVSDSGSGVKTRQYAWSTSNTQTPTSWTNFNNGATFTTPNSTGSYYLWIKASDNVGNTTTTKTNVFRVDQTPPTHVSSSITGERYKNGSTYWVRPGDILTVTFRQRDVHSGNNRGYIRLTGNGQDVRYSHEFNSSSKTNMVVVSDQFANTSSIQVQSVNRIEHDTTNGYGTLEWKVKLNTSGHNYSVQYYYRDNAFNNVGYTTVGNARVDGEAPTLSVSQSPTTPTNGNVKLTAIASDLLSGVKRIKKPDGTWVNGSTATYTVSSNGTYTFVAEDNVGNQKSVSITVSNIDKVGPSVSFSPNGDSTYKKSHFTKVTVSDSGSGVKSTVYAWSTSSSTAPSNWQSFTNGTTLTTPSGQTGTYYLWVRATDTAGNITTTKSNAFHLDNTQGSVSASPSNGDWKNTPHQVSLTFSDAHSGVKTRQYQWTTSTSIPTGGWKNYSSPVTQPGAGTYYLHYRMEDHAGNVTIGYAGPYRYEATAPTGDISYSPTGFTNGNVTISLKNIQDVGGSGYAYTKKPDGNTTTATTVTITVTENGTYSFTIFDKAGNQTVKRVTISNIDRQNPSFGTTYSPTGWTNQNVIIRLTNITDSGPSGYSHTRLPNGSVDYDTNVSYEVTTNGDYTFTVYDKAGNATSKTVRIENIDKVKPTAKITQRNSSVSTEVILTVNASDGQSGVKSITLPDGNMVTSDVVEYKVSKNGEYSFIVTDVAGNSTTVTATVTNIDTNPPKMNISLSPSDWTMNPVTIAVTAEDETGIDRIVLPNGHVVRSDTASFTVERNGTYTFHAYDIVGNHTSKSITVSNIDRGIPILEIQESGRTKSKVDIQLKYGDQ